MRISRHGAAGSDMMIGWSGPIASRQFPTKTLASRKIMASSHRRPVAGASPIFSQGTRPKHCVKWQDGRRARPIRLEMPWGMIPLWGDENVYRRSRGVLGSHVLGSAYLALEEWLGAQAAAGRSLAELFRLML
ncbi:hypothetical protein [Bradyrhizobium sp. CCBAU 11445]|uniref:hypothetical protein n=1 Tax=Bradyrhizobium sp. CCBAU 11445 TaxID=1630896 RepID=UPI002305C73F|nr:hypothetical protein [Bradyrhizobium sp. CCBAU 11445]